MHPIATRVATTAAAGTPLAAGMLAAVLLAGCAPGVGAGWGAARSGPSAPGSTRAAPASARDALDSARETMLEERSVPVIEATGHIGGPPLLGVGRLKEHPMPARGATTWALWGAVEGARHGVVIPGLDPRWYSVAGGVVGFAAGAVTARIYRDVTGEEPPTIQPDLSAKPPRQGAPGS